MANPQLHKTQVSILHSLRYAPSERFSALMRPTDHTSDTFKFHLRKLQQLGYVTKLPNGNYQLTPSGKEYANSINEQKRWIEKQPKLSILMIVSKTDSEGNAVYLLQKRARHPFYGYWSEIHGRAEWSEAFETTAKRQLERQTGLEAKFVVDGFRRVRDYDEDNQTLLEDKLFVILRATSVAGQLINTYSGGTNAWMTLDELHKQDKVFASTVAIIESLNNGKFYQTYDIVYNSREY